MLNSPTLTRQARRDAIAAFYTRYATTLRDRVRRRVNAPHDLVDDACQTAWAILLRRADVTLDPRGLAWLTTVAVNEALHVAAPGREQPAGSLALPDDPDADAQGEPPGDAPDPADIAIARDTHRHRVAHLRQLKPREQRELLLHAAGYRYPEIAALTCSTYTAINRRISEGRAQLGRLDAR